MSMWCQENLCTRKTRKLKKTPFLNIATLILPVLTPRSEPTRPYPVRRAVRSGYRHCIRLLLIFWSVLWTCTLAQDVDLSLTLSASKGFRLLGAAADDNSGYSVSAVGDVNNDGIDDVIVGARFADLASGNSAGISYVIFGRNIPGGAAAFGDIQLTTGSTALSPSVGFRILGATASGYSGWSVSAAGDVNNDGLDDIIVGANAADILSLADAGISYVIYGRDIPGGAAAFGDIQLTSDNIPLTPSVGFRILGAAAYDRSGFSVGAAGDVNNDGIDDVIVGAYEADPPSGADAGISYVIFGRNIPGGAAAFGDIQLTTTALSSSIGFRILGAAAGDWSGQCVSAAGDVNGDGIDDVIVGAFRADSTVGTDAGITYVIFGRDIPGGAAAFGDIQLTNGATALSASVGFRILGAAAFDNMGWSVRAAGDINGDGIDDVILGAYGADPPSGTNAGASYVIFGRNIPGDAAAFGDIQLTTGSTALSPSVGFRILGAATGDQSGYSVSAAGDVNGDGIDDIIVGAYLADPTSGADAGISYVIFGRNIPGSAVAFGDIQLTTNALSLIVGFRILGAAAGDQSGNSVSAAGDVNGDGIGDIIVGAPYVDPQTGLNAGTSYVVFGAYSEPTSQPSSQPSRQPSRQPTSQPSTQPTRQPTFQPSNQPSLTPTLQPSNIPTQQPSSQPTSQPSKQPSLQPASQPSLQPTSQPSKQPADSPSAQPSIQPTCQPFRQPTSQPSSQPVTYPSTQPSVQPTVLPTNQPTTQPVIFPSTQPSKQPSSQPTGQPSREPSTQPSSQPVGYPSTQPSIQPTGQPSRQPSGQPSTQPSEQPSKQPSCQPSVGPTSPPTSQPSMLPSAQPSALPTNQPTVHPSSVPSGRPSSQPMNAPSVQPTAQPSIKPSNQPSQQPITVPSAQPSTDPTNQPSSQPSNQPSCQPIGQPSSQPSFQPSDQPSSQPSSQPDNMPSSQPSSQPSRQPSSQPSFQSSSEPSSQPTNQPNSQPSSQPSNKPSSLPTSQPSAQPSSQPSRLPTARFVQPVFINDWVYAMNPKNIVTRVAAVGDTVWACGTHYTENGGSFCVKGTQTVQFEFPWNKISTILQPIEVAKVIISGSIDTDHFIKSAISTCTILSDHLTCTAKTISDNTIVAGSYLNFVNTVLYVGAAVSSQPSVTILELLSGNIRSYIYTSTIMPTITFLHVHSPPNFIGGFIAGTCMNAASRSYIFAGMVRADSGTMTGMYLTPVSSSILNSAELVYAMALEKTNPDSYIAGGLQLNEDTSMHAYVICVNSLYRRFIYGMRYKVRDPMNRNRRTLIETSVVSSSAHGIVLLENVLYVIINAQNVIPEVNRRSISILAANMATGTIIQQVHIYSHNASIQCTDVTITGDTLVMVCEVQYDNAITQSIVLSVSRELSFSVLPESFVRHEEDLLYSEPLLFKVSFLPLTTKSVDISTTDYTFNTADNLPSVRPTVTTTRVPTLQPSSAPSGQPSSSPTAAPSVSPQPSSQPSSSGPTNTYKPTVAPTLRPTGAPSRNPSFRPTVKPTLSPTLLRSDTPTTNPSTYPTHVPSSTKPTHVPSVRPTRIPTTRRTNIPTTAPSTTPTVDGTDSNQISPYRARESAIFGYSVAGMFGLLCLYLLWRCCIYKIHQVKRDNKRVHEMLAQDLPGKPRHPIFSAAAGLCCTLEDEEAPECASVKNNAAVLAVVPERPTNSQPNPGYVSQGAYMDGPTSFRDLEANMPNSSTSSFEISELSEASSAGEENSNSRENDESEGADVLSDKSMHCNDYPYETGESDADVPSDDSEVVYSFDSSASQLNVQSESNNNSESQEEVQMNTFDNAENDCIEGSDSIDQERSEDSEISTEWYA